MTSLAARERAALCDLALAVGPDAPTLCSPWTTRDLVAHLLVRERKPLLAGGILVPQLQGMTERAMRALAAVPYDELVGRLREAPVHVRAVDPIVNTLEFFVHHEDIRRAGAGWDVRPLTVSDEVALWRFLTVTGRGLVRPAGVPVTLRAGSRSAVLRRGQAPVVVTGAVSELTMFLFGRAQTRDLDFDGPPEKISSLRNARLGF